MLKCSMMDNKSEDQRLFSTQEISKNQKKVGFSQGEEYREEEFESFLKKYFFGSWFLFIGIDL
jgi:hypothetical protein